MKKIYPFIALLILASNLNLLSKNNKFLQVLPNIGVTCFEIDRNNCKWVGTALKGLIKYDGKDTISYNLSNTIMQTNEIDCLYLNDNDDIWIGTKKGLYVFDRKNNWRWYHTTNSGLPGIQIMSIIKDRNGYFWIGTNLGLAKFTENSGTIKVFNTENSNLKMDWINNLYIDRSNNFWIGQISGNIWYALNRLVEGDNITTVDYIYNYNITNAVYSIAEDNDGYLWMATNDDLFVFKDKEFFKQYTQANSLLPGSDLAYCTSTLIDKNNNIWIGMWNGVGLVRFDRTNWKIFDTTDLGEPLYGSIFNLRQDNFGNLLFFRTTAATPGLDVFNENGVDTLSILADLEDNQNLLLNNKLYISPNPATDYISISFTISEFSRPIISIFNSLGIEINRIDGKELSGQNSISLSTEEFPSGVYYCTLNTGKDRITKSFVVVK